MTADILHCLIDTNRPFPVKVWRHSCSAIDLKLTFTVGCCWFQRGVVLKLAWNFRFNEELNAVAAVFSLTGFMIKFQSVFLKEIIFNCQNYVISSFIELLLLFIYCGHHMGHNSFTLKLIDTLRKMYRILYV